MEWPDGLPSQQAGNGFGNPFALLVAITLLTHEHAKNLHESWLLDGLYKRQEKPRLC
jgi:hypothetical protein